jgi:hypothetical protein
MPTPSRTSSAQQVTAQDNAGDPRYSATFPGPVARRLVHPKDAQGAALATTSAKAATGAEYDVFDVSPATLTSGKEVQGLTYKAKKFYSNFACTVATQSAPSIKGEPAVAFNGTCGGRKVRGFVVDRHAHLYFVDVEGASQKDFPSDATAFLASFSLKS